MAGADADHPRRRAERPRHVAAIGSSDRCPAAALAADGSAALATQADVGGDNGLQLAARPPRGVRVGVAPSRRLGRPQAVRVRVTCPRRCSVRVAADLISGKFDSSRPLQPGTTLLRVPYFSGSASARSRPLRAARRVQLGIAVDDATGELRAQRTVVVRP
jgi:hypothetical protein